MIKSDGMSYVIVYLKTVLHENNIKEGVFFYLFLTDPENVILIDLESFLSSETDTCIGIHTDGDHEWWFVFVFPSEQILNPIN